MANSRSNCKRQSSQLKIERALKDLFSGLYSKRNHESEHSMYIKASVEANEVDGGQIDVGPEGLKGNREQ